MILKKRYIFLLFNILFRKKAHIFLLIANPRDDVYTKSQEESSSRL